MLKRVAIIASLALLISCSVIENSVQQQQPVPKLNLSQTESIAKPQQKPITERLSYGATSPDNLLWIQETGLAEPSFNESGIEKNQAQKIDTHLIDIIKKLKQQSGINWIVAPEYQSLLSDKQTKQIGLRREDCQHIKPPIHKTIKTPNRQLLIQNAKDFLVNNVFLLPKNGKLQVLHQVIDYANAIGPRFTGSTYGVNFQQTFNELPVFGYGGEIFFDFVDDHYAVCGININSSNQAINIHLESLLSKANAIRIAKKDTLKNKDKYLAPLMYAQKIFDKLQDPQDDRKAKNQEAIEAFNANQLFKPGIINLGINRTKEGKYILAYSLSLHIKGYYGGKHYLIDANNGKILFSYDSLRDLTYMRCGNGPEIFTDSQSDVEIDF